MSERIVLDTLHMTTTVDPTDRVYVRVNGDYVQKRGRDLQKGDVVVLHNEGVKKSLDEIIPHLEQRARYSTAQKQVFVQNSEGRKLTRLRVYALEGIHGTEGDAAAKTMLEGGDDFSADEYLAAAEMVVELGVSVGAKTIRERWLRHSCGTRTPTLAPQEWDNFEKLAEVDPRFGEIHESYDEPTGFHAAYVTLTGMHRSIMTMISKREKSGDRKKQTTQWYSDGRNKDDASFVLSQIMGEIDEDFAFSQITDIRSPNNLGEIEDSLPLDPELRRGVVTDELPVDAMPMQYIMEASEILRTLLSSCLISYIEDTLHERPQYTGLDPNAAFTMLVDVMLPNAPETKFMVTRGLTADAHRNIVVPTNRRERRRSRADPIVEFTRRQAQYTAYAAQIAQDLSDGKIDEHLGFDPNTIANMVDSINSLLTTLPQPYVDMIGQEMRYGQLSEYVANSFKNEVDPEARRDAIQRKNELFQSIQETIAYLEEEYGMTPRTKRLRGLSYWECGDDHAKGVNFLYDHRSVIDDRGRYAVDFNQPREISHYTRDDIVGILDTFGFEECLPMVPGDNF